MILVTGATGNVGAEVVQALVRAGEPVRALSRTARPPSAGIEQVTGDMNEPESLAGALTGVSAVFLLAGYRDMPGLLAEIRKAGVQRVVLLSGRSAGDSDTNNAVSRYMAASEAVIRESGVPWTFLRPSAFMANALRWVPQLRAGDVVSEPFAGVRIASIDPYDIAAVAVAAMLSPAHEGRVYDVSGPESLLPAERLAILGTVLGRNLTLRPQPNDEARAEMSATMPVEYVDAFFRFYVDGTIDESPVLPTVLEVTGRQPRTFEQWAKAHAGAFTSAG